MAQLLAENQPLWLPLWGVLCDGNLSGSWGAHSPTSQPPVPSPQVSATQSLQPEPSVHEKVRCLLQTLKSKVLHEEELCDVALGCHSLDMSSKSTGTSQTNQAGSQQTKTLYAARKRATTEGPRALGEKARRPHQTSDEGMKGQKTNQLCKGLLRARANHLICR